MYERFAHGTRLTARGTGETAAETGSQVDEMSLCVDNMMESRAVMIYLAQPATTPSAIARSAVRCRAKARSPLGVASTQVRGRLPTYPLVALT